MTTTNSLDSTTPIVVGRYHASNPSQGPYVPWFSFALLALGVVIVGLDVFFAKSVFDVLVNENETVSLMLALGVSGAGAMAALGAGIAAAERMRGAAGALLGVWCLIGVAMASTRSFKEVIDGNDFSVKDVVLAILMIGVYLGGAALFLHARSVWRPSLFGLWASRRAMRRADDRRRIVEGRYARVQHELTDISNARKRIVYELQSRLSYIDATQRELHAIARDRLALGLADPSQTSLFRSDIEEGVTLPRTQR